MSNNWSSTNKYDYWNKDNIVGTNNNNTVKKTVYSPSPTNFSEPKAAVFTGFTITGANTSTVSEFNVSGGFNKGWNFYCQPKSQGNAVFFSALGLRFYNTGIATNVSANGHYWTAGPSDTVTYARYLGFISGGILPQDVSFRAYGFSVRPVSE